MQQINTAALPRLWPVAAAAALAGGLAVANTLRARKAKRDNPPIGRFIEVDGVKLHVVEKGFGPPILLVHGNGVMLEDWIISGLFDDLAKSNRVIAIDRPGFGHSSRPRGISWTPERQADLFASLLGELGAKGALVVGHSYGTLVAAAMALNHEESISGVALIGGYLYPNPRADVFLVAGSAIPVYGDIINHVLMPLMAEALRKPINKKIFGPAEPTKRWRKHFSWAMALRPSRMRAGAADAVHMIPAAARLHGRYSRIKLPVTIVAGRGDRLVDTSTQAERLHKDLPHSSLTIVDGAGHMVHHTAPDEVAAALRAG